MWAVEWAMKKPKRIFVIADFKNEKPQASFFVSLVVFWAINLPKRDEKLVLSRQT